ncbi:hypothetical protein [Moheibacter sp.]|uniref:hypothetical protein n=1 Tax=Moheibacter sp. TaxID=1965316 RepID=UPI003C74AA00
METIIHKEIKEKISQLPDFLMEELSEYIDFLLYKKDKDWYDSLDSNQKKSIEQGMQDIKDGKTYTQDFVMEEMSQYIKSKKK